MSQRLIIEGDDVSKARNFFRAIGKSTEEIRISINDDGSVIFGANGLITDDLGRPATAED